MARHENREPLKKGRRKEEEEKEAKFWRWLVTTSCLGPITR
jgi:hypothetical protein